MRMLDHPHARIYAPEDHGDSSRQILNSSPEASERRVHLHEVLPQHLLHWDGVGGLNAK